MRAKYDKDNNTYSIETGGENEFPNWDHGIGNLTGQGSSTVTNTDTTRVITS